MAFTLKVSSAANLAEAEKKGLHKQARARVRVRANPNPDPDP